MITAWMCFSHRGGVKGDQKGRARVIEMAAIKQHKLEHDHDVRDDQTLPALQTATNQTAAYGYCALRLRQTCLAGLIQSRGLFALCGMKASKAA